MTVVIFVYILGNFLTVDISVDPKITPVRININTRLLQKQEQGLWTSGLPIGIGRCPDTRFLFLKSH